MGDYSMMKPANATCDPLETVNFEPLLPNSKIKPPPSNEDWEAWTGDMLLWTRLAWETLHKTKAEMVATIERERADPVLMLETTKGIRNTAALLDRMALIAQEADRRRLLCGAPLAA
jgi:hypothetical protein